MVRFPKYRGGVWAITRPWLLGGLVLAGASLVIADDAKKERVNAARKAVEEAGRDVGDVAREADLTFASKLVGKNLSGADDKTVGEIKDLMIDTEQGRVAFAVISHEDHRRTFLAVPLQDLSIRKSADGKKVESVRLVGDKDALKEAPSFTEDKWNEVESADFRRRVEAHVQKGREGTEATPVAREDGTPAGAGKLARASEQMRHKVENAQGEKIGNIEDLLVNTRTGKIEYVVVGMGGFLGIGEKRHAVPCSLLKPTGHDACRIDLSREKLAGAPTFELKGEEDAPARDPLWIASVHEYYGVTTPSSGKMLRGTNLLGWTVKTPAGDDLGKVHDVAIDVEEGKAAYVVLKGKGTLGFGGALFAMPWSALRFEPDHKSVRVAADKKKLDASKGFPAKNWPREADSVLFESSASARDKDVPEAAGGSERREDRGYAAARSRPYRLRDLLDYDLENAREKDLGEIKDIVFDEANGRIAYVAISVGGFLGIGDKLFAIPWQSLKVKPGREVFVLDVDKKKLQEAPGFNEKNWPTVATTDWVASVHRYYGVVPGIQPSDGEAVAIPFKLERGATFRYRVKERLSMPITPVPDSSVGKDPSTPRVDRDPARPDFKAERGASVIDYRLSVDETPADGSFTLSVIRLPSLYPTSEAGEGNKARDNERAEKSRESSRLATIKITKEGKIEKIEGAENESALRQHLHHILGTGIHGRSFKPGDIYTHDGRVARDDRAKDTIPVRPATTPPRSEAQRDFENAQLRFDGIRAGDGMRVASFVLLAPRPGPNEKESDENQILGRATYSLSDGLLEELRLRTSRAMETEESWATGDYFTIRRLSGRDEEGSERIISPGN